MRAFDWIFLAVLAVVVGLAYTGLGDNAFVLDAERVVRDNRLVSEANWGEIVRSGWWTAGRPEGADPDLVETLYRPVTLWWFALLHEGGGEDATALNLGNLALHVLNAALRYLFLIFLLRGVADRRIVAAGAALFAGLHGVSAEAVVGVVGAAELLCQLLLVASWSAFTAGERGMGPARGAVAILGSSLLFLLALGAKETAAAFPLVLAVQGLVFGFAPGGGTPTRFGRRLTFTAAAMVPFVLALVLWAAARVEVLGAFAPFDVAGVYGGFGAAERIASAFAVAGSTYLPALLWPFDLFPNIGHQEVPPPAGFGDLRVVSGMLCWSLLLAATVLLLARRRWIGLLGLFALAMMLPTSNLIVPIGAVGAFRFLYGPLFGISALLVAGAETLVRRVVVTGWAAAALLIAVLVAGVVGTHRLVDAWQDPQSLARYAERIAPGSPWALANRVEAEMLRGSVESPMKVAEALGRFDEIEPGLARIPSSGEIDDPTRLVSMRLCANRGGMLVNAAQAATTLDEGSRLLLEAGRAFEKALIYSAGRTRDAFDMRLAGIEVQFERLGLLGRARAAKEMSPADFAGQRDLILALIEDALGEAKRFAEDHADEIGDPRRQRLDLIWFRYAVISEQDALARVHLDRALQHDPASPEARRFGAEWKLQKGRAGEALEDLEVVIDAGRAEVSTYFLAARAASMLRDPVKTELYLRRSLELPARSVSERELQRQAGAMLAGRAGGAGGAGGGGGR